jgi:hypothetical protein
MIVSGEVLPAAPVPFLSDHDIAAAQTEISEMPLGERIAYWAERFLGRPYDPDPLGEYVTRKVLVADERVDCMYLSFRVLELALSATPEEAQSVALDKRFAGSGVVRGAIVENYEERFQYAEDMIDSGKWGREITGAIGPVEAIRGARGRDTVGLVSKERLGELRKGGNNSSPPLKNGDFIFFIKSPEKRRAGEIVGHIGIVKREKDTFYMIHASGVKNKGGSVKKIPLREYVSSMPFVGVRVSRFD